MNHTVDGIESPNPSFPQTIHNVSGDVVDKIENKNRFNPSYLEQGNISRQNGNEFSQSNYARVNFIKASPLTQYCITLFDRTNFRTSLVYFFNENQEFISATELYSGSSFNTVANCKYIRFTIAIESGSTYTTFDASTIEKASKIIQFEEGSTATPYVTHQEQNLPFTLEPGQNMYAQDYLADDGIHHVEEQDIWDGSESEWGGSLENGCFIYYDNDNKIKKEVYGSTSIVIICDYYKGVETNYRDSIRANDFSIGKVIGATSNQVAISDNRFSTVAEFKEWLSENPITVQYKLAEEVIEPYTPTQQEQYNAIKKAMSYKDTTVITLSSDDADPVTNVVAVRDMSDFDLNDIDDIKTAIVALGGVI